MVFFTSFCCKRSKVVEDHADQDENRALIYLDMQDDQCKEYVDSLKGDFWCKYVHKHTGV